MSDDRPHVVILAYACEVDGGSEEGAGWAWARAAAEIADVTLLTRRGSQAPLRFAARDLGLPITVVVVGPGERTRWLFRRKAIFLHYLLWQAAAARAIRTVERGSRVDVVHHLTWASDSLPSALRASRAPVRVWGPVGGTTGTAAGLYRYLSPRGRMDQRVRGVVNGALRRAFGVGNARRATLVAALNEDVADRFRTAAAHITVEANLALDTSAFREVAQAGPAPTGAGSSVRTAVFVGRLIPWKGLLLAVRAIASAPGWRLEVFGEGPEQARAEHLAAELGVAERVAFHSRVPRAQVLDVLAHADALLMPSFHDSAPWAAGEAAALGCPVVCLDAGGVALVADDNARVVPIRDGIDLDRRLAARLRDLGPRCEPSDRWRSDRLPHLLSEWYSPGSGDQQFAGRGATG